MIVEKNGYVVIYTQKGDVTLYDYLGQCITRGRQDNMTKEKALEMINKFSKHGIVAVC